MDLKPALKSNTVKDILGDTNLPLLTLDQHWLALFPREYKTERMKEYEKRIVELMKEEARVRKKINTASQKKSEAIAKINALTMEAYTYEKKSAHLEISKCKAIILRANSFFVLAEREIGKIEDNIIKVNRVLLEETIKICYSVMVQSKEQIDDLEPEIERMREELKTKITDISVHEQKYESTYRLLNKLVGPEIIDKLDQEADTEKKKWFWA